MQSEVHGVYALHVPAGFSRPIIQIKMVVEQGRGSLKEVSARERDALESRVRTASCSEARLAELREQREIQAASRAQKENAVAGKFPPGSKKGRGKNRVVMLTGDVAKLLGKDSYSNVKLSELSDSDLDKLHGKLVGKTAAPRGKAQQAIAKVVNGWDSGTKESLTEMARGAEFRGVHFAKIMSAADALKKSGLIEFDGVTVHKRAKLSDADAQHDKDIKQTQDKTAGSGSANAKYLNGLSPQAKAKILKAVAKHYAVSVSEIEVELTDRDAEALYEYLAFDRGMAMQVLRDFKAMRLASDKTARSYGLYGFSEKVAQLGLDACAAIRADAGRIAYNLHSRREAKHEQITAFLDTHCKTAQCNYSRLLAASYPDSSVKAASSKDIHGASAPEPRTVQAWLEWDEGVSDAREAGQFDPRLHRG
jgi:hypothetical protein